MFNSITAPLNHVQQNPDTHAAEEYHNAFFKTLQGRELTEPEQRAYTAAQAEKRADSFNTLSNSAAVVPTRTLNGIARQSGSVNGLFGEVRLFVVPSNMAIPVGVLTDPAAWHTEGATVECKAVSATNVTFAGHELMKVLSMSAAVKRMKLSAFESYITQENAHEHCGCNRRGDRERRRRRQAQGYSVRCDVGREEQHHHNRADGGQPACPMSGLPQRGAFRKRRRSGERISFQCRWRYYSDQRKRGANL